MFEEQNKLLQYYGTDEGSDAASSGGPVDLVMHRGDVEINPSWSINEKKNSFHTKSRRQPSLLAQKYSTQRF